MGGPVTYRGWAVRNDNPPAPTSSSGWSATSPDYDVDCDSESCWEVAGQQIHAATYDELADAIDAAIADGAAKAAPTVDDLVAATQEMFAARDALEVTGTHNGERFDAALERHNVALASLRITLADMTGGIA